ncbi:hypothetical protein FRC20_010432 [Serendipita sp. 405]|nr:hypothetical protein FRC15_009919 [Serendipita sp. 397]KAG8796027.1 hypothetical protein FRC16_009852 [Serendipita sp. 398]KAG8863932.1 hypothetical protein FRC20_010432 [Serendipita sp. 405]
MGIEKFAAECAGMSNEALIREEICQRRSIAGYVTSLTLSGAATVMTGGAAAPLTVPLCGFKLYKIESHRKELYVVRAELAKRRLSPEERRKRDVLIPVAMTTLVYCATLGIAGELDLVPDGLQHSFQQPIAEALDAPHDKVSEAVDKHQAFLLAEMVSPLTNAVINPSHPAGSRSQGHAPSTHASRSTSRYKQS